MTERLCSERPEGQRQADPSQGGSGTSDRSVYLTFSEGVSLGPIRDRFVAYDSELRASLLELVCPALVHVLDLLG